LEDAVELALAHSPVFDAARRAQDIADLQKRVAFANFLPSLDFTTTDQIAHSLVEI
jgi:outer membrane protein TolC